MNTTFIKDLLERAAKTFIQAFVVALALPTTDVFNLAAWKGAVIAAVAAGLSAVTSLISKVFADKNTASLVPEIKAGP